MRHGNNISSSVLDLPTQRNGESSILNRWMMSCTPYTTVKKQEILGSRLPTNDMLQTHLRFFHCDFMYKWEESRNKFICTKQLINISRSKLKVRLKNKRDQLYCERVFKYLKLKTHTLHN